jgi:HK97 family phage major capsid protein
MTNEEIQALTIEEIEARKAEIKAVVEDQSSEADFEALSKEVDSLEERKAVLVEEQRKADIQAVIEGAGEETTIEIPQEERKMDLKEIRSSQEYIDAFAEYIKTGKDTECRKLLTELASSDNGTNVVPVPTFVEDEIRTAWDNNKILARVKKAYMKGIVRVGFEISADGAVVHAEGATKPNEENLVLGVVELKPASIKKWITISDEAIDLKGEAFLRYIYDELTYQIAKKAEDELIAAIKACGTVSTNTPSTNVAVPVVVNTGTLTAISEAIAQLSDKAANPVVIMNKASYATFKALQYAANYPVDPFEGLDVLFNDTIAAFADATTGVPYAIVGDLGVGALANFPEGDGVAIKYDDLSLAEYDLVKIVGREYIGMGVVAPKAFVKIIKNEAS